eukprot:GHVR01096007.1.p1 GENE.GHVR01096007.1~~GHVR01096007.1.p1  ORF type:complete len:231 (+),score=31.02 GHVR01096007.1:76-693(+)
MTNERTYMDLDLLKEGLPNICLGLDEINKPTKIVNPNVILRSIALGIFPPEDTHSSSDTNSLHNFMNSYVLVNKHKVGLYEMGKVNVDDIRDFWVNCVPALKEKPVVRNEIHYENEMQSLFLEGEVIDEKSLEIIQNTKNKWNTINPWNVSIFQDIHFRYYLVLFGSKILEDRQIGEEEDFIYYYECTPYTNTNEQFIFEIVISN